MPPAEQEDEYELGEEDEDEYEEEFEEELSGDDIDADGAPIGGDLLSGEQICLPLSALRGHS